jgi:hypothetical protein
VKLTWSILVMACVASLAQVAVSAEAGEDIATSVDELTTSTTEVYSAAPIEAQEADGGAQWFVEYNAIPSFFGGDTEADAMSSTESPNAGSSSLMSSSSGEVVDFEYDANGRLVRATVSGGISDGIQERYEYDAADNRTLREVTLSAP